MDSLKKWGKLEMILPIIIIFFLISIAIATHFNVDFNTELYGASTKSDKPAITLSEIMDGEYQEKYEKWYSENFTGRNFLLKTYNQFRYSIFNGTNSSIVKGDNGYYYEKSYIEHYLKIAKANDQKFYDEYSKKLKFVQDKLEEQGKEFVYIISPGKANIYPEYIPLKYRLISKDFNGNSDYDMLLNSLQKFNVNYYDTHDTLISMKNNGYKSLYAKTGTHWNYLAAAYSIKDIFNELNTKYNNNILPNLDIQYYIDNSCMGEGEDKDIYNLLNIWKGSQDENYYHVNVKYDINNSSKLNAFIMGTSFSTQLRYLMEQNNGAFNKLTRYNYLQAKWEYENGNTIVSELNPDVSKNGVEKYIENCNLVMIESNVFGIPQSHSDFIQYLYDYYNNNLKSTNIRSTIENLDLKVNLSDLKLSNGKEAIISGELKNNSTNTLYGNEHNPVLISYHIANEDGSMYEFDGIRSSIETAVSSGQTIPLKIKIKSPDKKGKYILQISVVQEGIVWAENINNKLPISIPLIVE